MINVFFFPFIVLKMTQSVWNNDQFYINASIFTLNSFKKLFYAFKSISENFYAFCGRISVVLIRLVGMN